MKKLLFAIPVVALSLTACGGVQFNATCSDGHCTGTAGPAGPNASVSPSASIPGISASSSMTPQPAVTITEYVPVVQQCLPDPTESQLTALAQNVPGCFQLTPGQEQIFVTVIASELNRTPRSELHSQQGRDDWRDHQLAAAVQQAHQEGSGN